MGYNLFTPQAFGREISQHALWMANFIGGKVCIMQKSRTCHLSKRVTSSFVCLVAFSTNRRVFKANFELEFPLLVFLNAEYLLEGFVV